MDHNIKWKFLTQYLNVIIYSIEELTVFKKGLHFNSSPMDTSCDFANSFILKTTHTHTYYNALWL